MAKEKQTESERDWEAEHADNHSRYINGSARDYLKFAEKQQGDTFLTGQPIEGRHGQIALSIVNLVTDRTGVSLLEMDQINRRDLMDIAQEIVGQGESLDTASSLYERLQVIDAPTTPSKKDTGPLSETISQLHTAMNDLGRSRLAEEVNTAMEVAILWGEREDLNPLERCHGVAQTLYQIYGTDHITGADGETIIVSPAREYAKSYNFEYSDQIKARSMKSAKDLFGN